MDATSVQPDVPHCGGPLLLIWSPRDARIRVPSAALATARVTMTSPITPTAAVTCSALSLRWPDDTTVFDGLNLTIGPGRTGLAGANGAGKSTLLRPLAGQLRPSQGSVTI